jgi:hypothetical protein
MDPYCDARRPYYKCYAFSYNTVTYYFFIIGGVGTKSTRYCGHFWPIVQAPDDRRG